MVIIIAILLIVTQMALATVYEIGPDKEYQRIIDCPTYDLRQGDTIKVYYRDDPYREKFLLHGVGTSEAPIVLIGIPDDEGNKPIIDGVDAVTSRAFSYWNEPRQIILVGQYEPLFSDHIIIDGFEIRNAHPGHSFTDDHLNAVEYAENACGIRAEYAGHLTIRNCDLHNNANGFQNGSTNRQQYVTLERCHIYDNGDGVDPTRYLEHNVYLGGEGVHATIQYCWFGELLNDGQQLKSRAETNIIRYNWIEGGHNSQLDLVEGSDSQLRYDAWVYGNVIIKPDSTNNSRFVHFGGDQGGSQRIGRLYFFNNTCIINSTRNFGTRRLFEISRDSASIIADNNIFYMRDNSYEVWSGLPNISGSHNWFSDVVRGDSILSENILGDDPGFVDIESKDFHLLEDSPCRNIASGYAFPEAHSLNLEYVPQLSFLQRYQDDSLDLARSNMNQRKALDWEALSKSRFRH